MRKMEMYTEETRSETEKKKKKKRLPVTGTKLKIIGSIFLLIYSISRILIQNGMMGIGGMNSSDLAEAIQNDSRLASLSGTASVLQLIGYMAIPIFAFLLAEGFIHTKNFRKYLGSMVILAVISEIPFDWAVNQSFLDLSSQNIVFSSVIALIALYGMSQLEPEKGFRGFLPKIGQLLIVVAAVLWSLFARCSFGLGTILLTSAYYMFRKQNFGRLFIGCALSMIYYSAPLSSLLIWAYNGERGSDRAKYFFYALYPAQLLILGLAARLV